MRVIQSERWSQVDLRNLGGAALVCGCLRRGNTSWRSQRRGRLVLVGQLAYVANRKILELRFGAWADQWPAGMLHRRIPADGSIGDRLPNLIIAVVRRRDVSAFRRF